MTSPPSSGGQAPGSGARFSSTGVPSAHPVSHIASEYQRPPAAADRIDASASGGKVAWVYAIEDAEKSARKTKRPYVLFFCPEESAKTAGEGAKKIAEFKQANGGVTPTKTVFDDADVLSSFSDAGIEVFSKIAASAENIELLQKHNAAGNTCLILAPDGEVLGSFAGPECTAQAVRTFLTDDFARRWRNWKDR